MPIFRYTARDEKKVVRRGVVRAKDLSAAGEFLRKQGYVPFRLKPYCDPPEFMPCLVTGVFLVFLTLALASLVIVTTRNLRNYHRLLTRGVSGEARITRTLENQTGNGVSYDYEYEFRDGNGVLHTGRIMHSEAAFSRKNRFSRREVEGTLREGAALTVTFLPEDPSVHVPFPMTQDRVNRPLKAAAGPVLTLLAVLALVVLAFRTYLRQSLPVRTRAYLDKDAGPEPEFLELFRGEFLPQEKPEQVLVAEEGTIRQKTLVGRVERAGLPSQLQMLACLAAYYIVSLSVWAVLPETSRFVMGKVVSPAWLAVGLSVFVVPVLLFSLGLKLPRPAVVAAAASAAVLHLLVLRHSALQRPEISHLYQVVSRNPLYAFFGWGLPTAAMMAVERWKKLKELLRLELPIYE